MEQPTEEKPTELEQLQLRVRQLEQFCDDLEEAVASRRMRDHHTTLVVAGLVIGFALALHVTAASAA